MRKKGYVRRIDDLGKVVIPMEVRKALKVTEGDTLEIFIEKGNIVLKKYVSSPPSVQNR
jgi:AbrB family looped-hinge helix DNA binding protein